MDTRFRNLQRAAQLAGIGSAEDFAYVSAQRQMGLPLSFIYAAAEMGDVTARQMLESDTPTRWLAFENAHRGTMSLYLRSQLNGFVLPFKLTTKWSLDCIKRILEMAFQKKAGRGKPMFAKEDDHLDLLRQTISLIGEIERWHTDPNFDLESLVEPGHHYVESCEEQPTGTKANIADCIALATRYLLQVIFIEEHGNAEPPYIFTFASDNSSAFACIAESIVSLEAAAKMLLSSAVQPMPVTKVAFMQYRTKNFQNLADILFDRSWNRPTGDTACNPLLL